MQFLMVDELHILFLLKNKSVIQNKLPMSRLKMKNGVATLKMIFKYKTRRDNNAVSDE